jgi:hypothetical protein
VRARMVCSDSAGRGAARADERPLRIGRSAAGGLNVDRRYRCGRQHRRWGTASYRLKRRCLRRTQHASVVVLRSFREAGRSGLCASGSRRPTHTKSFGSLAPLRDPNPPKSALIREYQPFSGGGEFGLPEPFLPLFRFLLLVPPEREVASSNLAGRVSEVRADNPFLRGRLRSESERQSEARGA